MCSSHLATDYSCCWKSNSTELNSWLYLSDNTKFIYQGGKADEQTNCSENPVVDNMWDSRIFWMVAADCRDTVARQFLFCCCIPTTSFYGSWFGLVIHYVQTYFCLATSPPRSTVFSRMFGNYLQVDEQICFWRMPAQKDASGIKAIHAWPIYILMRLLSPTMRP